MVSLLGKMTSPIVEEVLHVLCFLKKFFVWYHSETKTFRNLNEDVGEIASWVRVLAAQEGRPEFASQGPYRKQATAARALQTSAI